MQRRDGHDDDEDATRDKHEVTDVTMMVRW